MSDKNNAISVVMAVCARDDADQLKAAIDSVVNQTLQPEQIVIVADGPVGDGVKTVLEGAERSYPGMMTVVRYEKNMGPAYAWNAGIEASRNELIARMDSDDISRPYRFETQQRYMENEPDVDLMGGFICEFTDGAEPGAIDRVRRVPLGYQDIVSAMKKRNSINHVTVMFRKSAVVEAGGYYQINNHVDYFLWVRMAMLGKKFKNIEDILVDVRASEGQITRRGGLKYVLSEIYFYYETVRLGFMSPWRAMINLAVRFPFRVSPMALRKKMYSILRKN